MSTTAKWISQRLSALLDTNIGDDVANYLLNIPCVDDLEQYLGEILNKRNKAHSKFIDELVEKYKLNKRIVESSQNAGITVYHKNADGEDYIRRKAKSKGDDVIESTNKSPGQSTTPVKGKGKGDDKNRFVNLYSDEGRDAMVIKIPGRHKCECLASKHKLVGNCLQCGRIVCEQEGSGPCHFCGNLVCSAEEREIIDRGSKKGDKLHSRLLNAKFEDEEKGLEKAIAHKNRLLEYDKTCSKRTQVMDDQVDYFTSGSWMTSEEKSYLKNKEEKLRQEKFKKSKNVTLDFDFAGRSVKSSERRGSDIYSKSTEQDTLEQLERFRNLATQGMEKHMDKMMSEHSVARSVLPRPQLVPVKSETPQRIQKPNFPQSSVQIVQDEEQMFSVDNGVCLSMHQPWASLLVRGIKRHEGRSWGTSHRGRLWIASTGKEPPREDINSVEAQYRFLRHDDNLPFPNTYPHGCLLGCVTVTDCLAQDEYKEKFANDDNESESPFVFICDDARELVIKLPVKGKHKIWSLDKGIHQSAKQALTMLTTTRE